MIRDFAEPMPWRHAAYVDFWWNNQQFKLICQAGDVREEIYEGRMVTWLVLIGISMLPEPVKMGAESKVVVIQVPASYITRIEDGPTYRVKVAPTEYKVGLFTPDDPDPSDVLGVDEVRRRVGKLLRAERN